MTKVYQDQWVKGQLVEKGTVECAHRYKIIKAFCQEKYGDKPFSVCDIGASMSYFGLRLCEDFSGCSVIGFEYDHFEMRAAHVEKNEPTRLMLLNHKLHVNHLAILKFCCHFDVILILNVLHHVGNEFDFWLNELRELGDNVIAEFAVSDSRSRRQGKDYRIPSYAKILGYGQSHIKRNVRRPIMLISGHKQDTKKDVQHERL